MIGVLSWKRSEAVMRVLMFSWEFPPHVVGGLGKHVAELAPALHQILGNR